VKTVMVISPFRASATRSRFQHLEHAKKLCALAARSGAAPFASHVFYPQFLNEDDDEDRQLGLDCEKVWIAGCNELWVWDAWGISDGMKSAILFAKSRGVPVRFRLEITAWKSLV
jgi:peroxiredoxin